MPLFGELRQRQIWVPYNTKIADINDNDVLKHTLNLATALGETRKIIAIITEWIRIAGAGAIDLFPNEGIQYCRWTGSTTGFTPIVIKDGTNRLQYQQGVAATDWDVWCFGYVVEA